MKIGLVQIGSIAGDLEGNVDRCVAGAEKAAFQGAELIVLPAMAVPGAMPRDILFDHSFVEANGEATADLAHRIRSLPPTLVGTVVPCGNEVQGKLPLLKAAALLDGGEIARVFGQRNLRSGDVFFEPRWFVPGNPGEPFDIAGTPIGVVIDNDLLADGWEKPAADLVARGAEVLVCLAASPYRRGVGSSRIAKASSTGVPTVVVNACGAADDVIFDGASFVLDRNGALVAQLDHCREAVQVVDIEGSLALRPRPRDWQEETWQALKLGFRAFVDDNGMDRVTVGLSGGLDSSVTAVLACQALGADRVMGIAIPSRFTDARSTECARQLATTLGMHFEHIELDPMHRAAESSLGVLVDKGVGAENLQARLRMVILTAWVNRHGGLLLNTSNKTELALGYGTLYGDLAGSLSPLGDVTKTDVFGLARWVNRSAEIIPPFVLERPPSAELAPDQVDPFDYDRLAPALESLVLADQSNEVLRRSEHKRQHHGVILKVSARAFGCGRVMPITRR